jgi:osmotically-inducible protein OsmY
MRRFLFGVVIASMTAAAPVSAFGGDREIADAIISVLKKQQSAGQLKGFDIDLSVQDGNVTLAGNVASREQLNSVLKLAKMVKGVRTVETQVEIAGRSNVESTSMRESLDSGSNVELASSEEGGSAESAIMPTPLPASNVSPQDAAITEKIIGQLSADKNSGTLRHFELDVSTVGGEVWARGYVSNPDHKRHVLSTIQRTAGVRKVIDDITIAGDTGVRTASGESASSMPVAGSGAPQAFAPSLLTAQGMGDGGMQAPVPMQGGAQYSGGVPRYDQPNMPSYAWPSYAAYPNYAAVTYPKQYSASAWPYIGPFYPYPQVPLGWRKVQLEWDDGLWYLDFSSKR